MAANTSWPESLLQPLPLNDKPSVRSHNAQQVCMEVQVFRVLMTIHLNEKFEVLTANKHLWSDITILMDHMASVYLHVYSSELLGAFFRWAVTEEMHWAHKARLVGGATASCPPHPSFTTAVFKEVFPQEISFFPGPRPKSVTKSLCSWQQIM